MVRAHRLRGARRLTGASLRRVRRRFRPLVLATVTLLLLAGEATTAVVAARRPRHDRTWTPEQARLPAVRLEGALAHVSDVRAFHYTARDRYTPAYDSRRYDLDALTSVWFVVTPFSKTWRGPAHTFLSFGFGDTSFVSISVEARREPGEEYGPLAGLFRRYELIYVIGDERDLIGQRAAFGDYPVYLYPVRASPERIREVFVTMLERADALRVQPEFYNTLTNNCTSNVVRHVNQVAPRTVPGGLKVLLPGYSDEVAHRLGLLDTDLDIGAARERFRINDRARRWLGDPDFSRKIRGLGKSE